MARGKSRFHYADLIKVVCPSVTKLWSKRSSSQSLTRVNRPNPGNRTSGQPWVIVRENFKKHAMLYAICHVTHTQSLSLTVLTQARYISINSAEFHSGNSSGSYTASTSLSSTAAFDFSRVRNWWQPVTCSQYFESTDFDQAQPHRVWVLNLTTTSCCQQFQDCLQSTVVRLRGHLQQQHRPPLHCTDTSKPGLADKPPPGYRQYIIRSGNTWHLEVDYHALISFPKNLILPLPLSGYNLQTSASEQWLPSQDVRNMQITGN